jgi:hypothetical protein
MGSGGSKTKTELVEIVNDVYSESIVSVVQNCGSNINVFQKVEGNCQAFPDYVDDLTLPPSELIKKSFSANRSCLACSEAQDIDIETAWIAAGGEPGALDLGPKIVDGVQISGICDLVCLGCLVQNVNQDAKVGFEANCQITNNVMQEMENKFQADITQKLKENKDVLGQLTETFGALLGGGDESSEISTLITSRLRNITNSSITQSLTNNVNVAQTVEVTGRSVYADGLTFNADAEFISRNLAKNDIFSALTSESEASVIQEIHDRNNTIGDLARTIADTFEDVAGQWETTFAIIGVVVVILIAGGALVTLFLFMQTGKNLTKPFKNLAEAFDE